MPLQTELSRVTSNGTRLWVMRTRPSSPKTVKVWVIQQLYNSELQWASRSSTQPTSIQMVFSIMKNSRITCWNRAKKDKVAAFLNAALILWPKKCGRTSTRNSTVLYLREMVFQWLKSTAGVSHSWLSSWVWSSDQPQSYPSRSNVVPLTASGL